MAGTNPFGLLFQARMLLGSTIIPPLVSTPTLGWAGSFELGEHPIDDWRTGCDLHPAIRTSNRERTAKKRGTLDMVSSFSTLAIVRHFCSLEVFLHRPCQVVGKEYCAQSHLSQKHAEQSPANDNCERGGSNPQQEHDRARAIFLFSPIPI